MRVLLAAVVLAVSAGAAAAQPPMEALPSILHLQLSQRPAWRAYKDATAEQSAEGAREASRTAELNALPTPARLDALRRRLAQQSAAFERQAQATAAFYAVLSPDQRQVFDDITRLPVPPRPGRFTSQADGGPSLANPPPGADLPPPG